MYKETPWTLNKKDTTKNRTRKSSYIKERQADLAISTARVLKLFELHKEKTFTTGQVAEALGLSDGTVSSILNRLSTLGDKIVVTKISRPHPAYIYQHRECAPMIVPFSYKKKDPIISIIEFFQKDENAIYTKDKLLNKLACSESMLRRSLQILLLQGDIKLVGSINGKAQYQYKTGNAEGAEISHVEDSNYIKFNNYLEEKKLKDKRDDIKKILGNVKTRLFYSSTGLTVEYLREDLDKAIEKLDKKKFLGLF